MRKIPSPPPEVEAKNVVRDKHARLMGLTFVALARNSRMVLAATVAGAAAQLHAYLASRGQVDAYAGELFEKLAGTLTGSADGDDDIPF